MDNKKPWGYDPDQDGEATMSEALDASERESSLYSYPNAFYLAEPTPQPANPSPYVQQPTSAVESLAPNFLPRVAGPDRPDSRYAHPPSQAERQRVANTARLHLASLYADQSQRTARPQVEVTDTRTQAERRRDNNPFRPRHDISRSDHFGRPYLPPPNLGNEPYRDIWASQPTDRTLMARPERLEDQVERLEAVGLLEGMMSDEEVRGEVERSRNRRMAQGSVDDRGQEEQRRVSFPSAPVQITEHGAMRIQQQSRSVPAASQPVILQSGGMDQHQSMTPPAQLSSTKKCGMCGQQLPLSMFATGMGYQTGCAPCREKHNASEKANAENRKEDDRRDEASGHRACKTCGQRLALELYFGGQRGSRGEEYYTKCFACRGEAGMKKGEKR